MDNSGFSEVLDKYIKEDKINHAYLIETNSDNRIDLAYLLINKIFKLEEKELTIDDLIINNDLYILKTDLQVIKKEEIINIKTLFKTKSIFFGKRVYIIEEAEKLNSSSANTLLKFLEEPDEDIIAILLTDNKYHIIDTILSRCQEIRYYDNSIYNRIELKYCSNIIDFLLNINENKIKSIAFISKFITKDMFERVNFKEVLDEMLYIYYDILQFKSGLNVVYSNDYLDKIELLSKDSYDELNKKILCINKAIEKNNINGNTRLIMDNIIIDMFGGE